MVLRRLIAHVDGITVGGPRVAQAQREHEHVISVALDTAHTGTVGDQLVR